MDNVLNAKEKSVIEYSSKVLDDKKRVVAYDVTKDKRYLVIELDKKKDQSGDKVVGWVKMFGLLTDVMRVGGAELRLLGYLINEFLINKRWSSLYFDLQQYCKVEQVKRSTVYGWLAKLERRGLIVKKGTQIWVSPFLVFNGGLRAYDKAVREWFRINS